MNLRTVPATLIIGGAALLLAAGLGWMLLLGPLVGDIGEASQGRTDAQDRNSDMTVQLSQLQRQAEELPQTQQTAEQLTAIFPPTADQPGFFAEVADAAVDAGIDPRDILSLDPGAPVLLDPTANDSETDTSGFKVTKDIAVQSVSISINGPYAKLSAVLANLEKMDRAYLVQSVDLAPSNGEKLNELTLTVVGATFVAPPLGPAPAP